MGMGAAVAAGPWDRRSALPSTGAVETGAGPASGPVRPPPLPPASAPALEPPPVPTRSSAEDAQPSEPRSFLPRWPTVVGLMRQRLRLLRDELWQKWLRYEPRAKLFVSVGWLAGAVLLVALVAAVWRHCGGQSQVRTAAASATPAPPPPAPDPEPPQPTPSPAPSKPFSVYAARRALDGTSRNVLSCRRDKKWGVALATVTFANDGSVSHVVVGVPFRGTPTGECVADDLSAARVAPFAGRQGVMVYQFFVALK
jgi:hypothetical protein